MTTENKTKSTGEQKSTVRLSKDGKFRSFPKAPQLIQYVSSGTHYACLYMGGKIIRQSLGTTGLTTAQLKLVDSLKDCTRFSTTRPTQSMAFHIYGGSIRDRVWA